MPHAHHGSVDVVGEAEAMSRDEPLFQCIAYKATRLSEIVCKRTVTLFKDRFTTAHQDLSGEKCWYLDRSCKLEPEYVEEILVPEKRSVRPPGAWTVTAKLGTVTGSGQSIELVRALARSSGIVGSAGYLNRTASSRYSSQAAQTLMNNELSRTARSSVLLVSCTELPAVVTAAMQPRHSSITS
eukprot:GHUV01029215.1.p1 GENE.GHUV01029215.1~~GHUV01029215.1.p1  ORF type:complete len:184 (+),score=15.22 GHUV01029215.1:178-729(+)